MQPAEQGAPPDCGGRFSILSFLGAGGMGSVYEAYDHQRKSQVAIKLMRRSGGPWIYRFKREFRSLAGIVHPNLVTLHELIEWEGQWLFTMERVPGVSFGQIRPPSGSVSVAEPPVSQQVGTTSPAAVIGDHEVSRPLMTDVFQIGDALRQLCDGLAFLHGLGLAHGDVKPANALIAPDGRVVILDFGIVRDWLTNADDESLDEEEALYVFGTPGYLAPERLCGQAANPASDMYAVGVILFQVLTAADPDGRADPQVMLKAARGGVRETNTSAVRRRVMENLCVRLMNHSPEARPTAVEVREAVVFGAARAARRTSTRLTRGVEEFRLVAREAELETIRNALLDRRPMAPHVVIVSGESGIGKTELMRQIIDKELPSTCLVLEGTCYERERVSYRAMDRVVDDLSSKLLALDRGELQELASADLAAVSRMFPTLRRVPEIDRLCGKSLRSDVREAHEQRRAAAATLARMLALVAAGRRLILYVDDLHWGDEESGIVMRDLLHGAPDLALCLVGCHRRPLEEGAFLTGLFAGDAPIRRLEVQLEGLSPGQSEEFARALLGPAADADYIARVAAEAHGNPFLIRELIEFGAGRELDELALRSAVAQHVDQLSQHARGVLEVLAVAGRRLDVDVVRDAAGIGQTLEAAILLLRGQHLIKASDINGQRIEPYHDRIREVIVQGLAPPALAARHGDIARALERGGDPDPAILGFHLEGAGEPRRAAEAILLAAQTAEASLAPLNAAQHYAKVVELVGEDDPRRRLALEAQARNLSAAGRTASAAPLYTYLALNEKPDEALKLRRKAAEAWIYAGEFELARVALHDVLEAAGVRLPRTLLGAFWGIARHRLWLWRRQNRYTPTPEAEIAPERLVRVDAYENAGDLASTIDLVRAFLMQSAHIRESLTVGEPRRVTRALVETIVIEGIGGERSSPQGPELLRIARQASEMGDFREERALIRYAAGVHAALNGRYADVVAAVGDLADAPDLSRSVRQLRTLRSVLGYSRWWLGQWRVLTSEYRAWILDAVERGDQLTACSFRLEQCGQWGNVLDDEPEEATEQVARALASPIGRELSFGHLAAKQTRAWVALYMGRADEAERALRLKGAEKVYMRIQRSRVEIAVLHAYAALARGSVGLRRARFWMRKVDREGLIWAEPIVRLIAASIAAQEGRRNESVKTLEAAISGCDQLGYGMFSAAASWRLGVLRGGAEGEALCSAAQERIAEQGAKRPDRIVRALAPGFGDALG